MKRTLQVMLALLIVGMFIVSPVAAATSQGLEWGCATGDSYSYTMSSDESNLNEELFFNISSMPSVAIEDPLTDWSDVPKFEWGDIGAYWANDTEINPLFLVFVFFPLLAVGYAVPIGNFTLLTTLAASEYTGETMIDETNVWGVEFRNEVNSTHDNSISVTYSRVDGFFTEYSIELINSVTDDVEESFEVVRDEIPQVGLDTGNIMQLLQDNILLVVVGIGVLVILAVVCKKR